MNALGFSPLETYRIIVAGDDLGHLTQLIADDRGLEDDCERCERIRRAVAVAEYHEIAEGVR